MAVTTEQTYVGNGSTTNYSFTFPYLKSTDVNVQVDGAVTTAWTFANATTVQFNTAPANGAAIKILRNTNVDNLTATFYAGSAIKSEDLNDNYTQNLYKTQEIGNRTFQTTGDSTMIGHLKMGEDTTIIFEGATDNAHETTLTVTDPTADRTITLPNVTGNVVTTGDTGTVTSTMISNGTITNDDIASNAAIDGSKIASATQSAAGILVATDKQKLDGIEAGATGDQTNAEIRSAVEAATDSNVFTDADHTKLNGIETSATADQTNAEIRAAVEAASDSNVFTDADHTKLNAIEASATADQSDAEIRAAVEAANDSNVFTDADHTKLNAIAANANNYSISSDLLDEDDLSSNSATKVPSQQSVKQYISDVTQPKDADLTTLSGMQTGTSSVLAGGTALAATLTEINSVCENRLGETTITDDDAKIPTSGAVVDYVAAQLAPIGGLEVIANDASFPNTQPSAGVVISIADAGGLVVSGSGSSTTGRTVGNSTVTINNIASNFNSTTIDNGVAMMVSSTGSGQIYNYHKATLKEADLLSLSGDINDFAERYRVSNSAPTSSLDEGDLWWDSATDKLKVYDGSAWGEVASSGDFYINTISSFTGTGGNSATFNGTAWRFVLSNPGSSAQQHIVSVNGVLQKPTAGTSQPAEGFAIDGSSILFSAAPPTGSDFFICTIGNAVSIGTPSDNTISTIKIQNLAVDNTKVATNAAIAGTKISPDFGNQDVIVNTDALFVDASDKEVGIGTNAPEYALHIKDDGLARLRMECTSTSSQSYSSLNMKTPISEWSIYTEASGSANYLKVFDVGNSTNRLKIDDDGHFEIPSDSQKVKFGASGDLEIYHNGSNSIINNNTGQLRLQGDLIRLMNPAGSEVYLEANNNGNVELYHDNTKKLETNATGIEVNGSIVPNADNTRHLGSASLQWSDVHIGNDLYIADNGEARFGEGNDLKIFHGGTDSHIENDTGQLKIASDTVRITNGAVDETQALFTANGASELYYDNAKKFQSASHGVNIYDTADTTVMAQFDNSAGTVGFVYGANANEFGLLDGQQHWLVEGRKDAEVRLYYDGVKKFETTSDGAQIHGKTYAEGAIDMPDDAKLLIGDSDDLEIYHDGTDSIISNATGTFYLKPDGDLSIQDVSSNELRAKFINNGSAELYHNGTKKARTTSSGWLVESGYLHAFKNESDSAYNSGATSHVLQANANGTNAFVVENSADTNPYGMIVRFSDVAVDNNTVYFLRCSDSGATRMTIYSSGDVNTSDDGTLTSDETLKENIVDATSKLEDIKKLKVRNFNWKASYHPEKSKQKHIGFIAQEVEQIFPGLIQEHDISPGDPDDGHTPVMKKSIKQAWAPILVKALQEAVAKIETLETKVAALEAK